MIHRWYCILIVAACSSAARAQQRSNDPPPPARSSLSASSETGVDTDSHQAQVQAATSNGAAALREQVLIMHLTREVDVRDFVDKTHTSDGLSQTLQAAQPVGGPRWVDDQTCQVQLEIPGSAVARFLQNTAREKPSESPVKPDQLKSRLASWNNLKFSAIGSSAGGDSIDLVRPRSTGKWEEISDHARRIAVDQAHADAVHQAILALSPVALDPSRSMKDALDRPAIAERVGNWLQRQPVTRIEFLDDLKLSVTISLSPRTLVRIVKSAVTGDAVFLRGGTKIDWDQVRKAIEAGPAIAVGTAAASLPPPTSLPTIVLPLQPPDWVDQQLDAEANAHGEGSQLKVGRAAEVDATEKIRSQFLQLRLDARTTLGDAARSDEQIAQAVARAMRLARTYKVDYQTNGDVHVRVRLDLRDAWDELRATP